MDLRTAVQRRAKEVAQSGCGRAVIWTAEDRDRMVCSMCGQPVEPAKKPGMFRHVKPGKAS